MLAGFDRKTLVGLVLAHLDTRPASIQFEPIRTGKHNSSFWASCDAGHFVLRIAPPDDAGFLFYERRMMLQEPSLHALIRDRTSIPVAEIVGYDFDRTQIGRDYLLMTALAGTPLSDFAKLTHDQYQRALVQVGQYLAQLHALTAPCCLNTSSQGYLGEHRPMEPQASWSAAFQIMWNRLVDDVSLCGGYSPREAQFMRNLLDKHLAHFDRPVIPRLLHMDVWSQNILIGSSANVTGLVDFDRALWGDKEIEFAVLDYCGISELPFWKGYGRNRDESHPAQIRRLFYLLYEIQKYIPIRIWRRSDPAGAARYKQQSLALADQL